MPPRRDDYFRNKWEIRLQKEIPDKTWKQCFIRTINLTMCTKLRAFQYRQTNWALTTNIDRFRCKLRNDAKCTFCEKHNETVEHLLVRCNIVRQKVWYPLKRWLYYFCFINFEIDEYEIIFNVYKDSFADMVNMIILIAKQYIYATKCLNNNLSFRELIQRIQMYKTIEEIINAKQNGKNEAKLLKWQMYDKI